MILKTPKVKFKSFECSMGQHAYCGIPRSCGCPCLHKSGYLQKPEKKKEAYLS